MIETPRLRLIPATLRELEAELEGPAALARVTGVRVPADWPPELFDRGPLLFVTERLRAHPDEAGWWLHYFVLRDEGTSGIAIGCGGYKGPPRDGAVEIGYSVLAGYRRRGLAAEATEGLVGAAFRDPRVERVVAETLPELVSSIGVLERCGFRFVGEGSEEGVIRYERPRSGSPR